MDSFNENLIEYVGLSKINLSHYNVKKLCSLDKVYNLKENQGDILDISRVYVDVNILNTKKILSPMATNYEGESFENDLLVFEACLSLNIEYIEDSEVSGLNIINIKKNFTNMINLKDNDEIDKLSLNAYTLKTYVKRVSRHKIFYYANIAIVSE